MTLQAASTVFDASPAAEAGAAPSVDAGGPPSLDAPAGEFLATVPWEGQSPDPAVLSAAAFLDWL